MNNLLEKTSPPTIPVTPKDLSAEQPPIPIDEDIIGGALQALQDGITHYVEVEGVTPLREALAQHLASDLGAHYDPDQILVTAGVQEARFLAIQVLGNELGSIAIPQSVHPGVRQAIGVRPFPMFEMPVASERGFLPSPEAVKNALEREIRLLYLESPTRLTGTTYSKDDLQAISELLEEYQAIAVIDQGLAPWVMHQQYFALADGSAGARERILSIGEAWPGSGLESWYIGYIGTPTRWFESLRSHKQVFSICTGTPAQYGALAAASSFHENHQNRVGKLARIKERLLLQSSQRNLDPVQGAAVNILAVHVNTEKRAQILGELNELGLQMADGTAFGTEGIVRLLVTFDNRAEAAIEQMAARLSAR